MGRAPLPAETAKPRHVNAGWPREQELLGVSYFHVVFTLPQELNPLCQKNAKMLYNLLFRASAETLLELAADPQHLGAEIGFLSILHTWGQNLSCHPHAEYPEPRNQTRSGVLCLPPPSQR